MYLSSSIDDPDPLVEVPHRIVDLEAELLPQPDMVLERRRQIAQHRIVLGGQRDQVDRVGRHDLILAPVQILQAHRHVQRRADIQADGQAVQLAHDDVFQAAPHQLLAALEHLRPDESGDIVDMEPGAPRLHLRELCADGPAEAVLSGFEHHHVDAVRGAIGELGALAGLEVEPVSFALSWTLRTSGSSRP